MVFSRNAAPLTQPRAFGSWVLRTNHEPWVVYRHCAGRGNDQPCKRPSAETETSRGMFRPRQDAAWK